MSLSPTDPLTALVRAELARQGFKPSIARRASADDPALAREIAANLMQPEYRTAALAPQGADAAAVASLSATMDRQLARLGLSARRGS